MAEQMDVQEFVTASKAAEALGVNKVKIAELLRSGMLPHEVDPLDRRKKLIPWHAVERLLRQHEGRRLVDPKARRRSEESERGTVSAA